MMEVVELVGGGIIVVVAIVVIGAEVVGIAVVMVTGRGVKLVGGVTVGGGEGVVDTPVDR